MYVCISDRSRQELSNAYLLVFGFDTAENQPASQPASREQASQSLPKVRTNIGSYEGRSPTQGPGRLSLGGAPYTDDARGGISGVRPDDESGQVRFLLGRTATSLSSAQITGLRPLAPR